MKFTNKKYEVLNTNKNKRIITISDIHFYKNTKVKLFEDLEKNIKKLKPDYICIPGDIIDSADALKKCNMNELYDFLRGLGTIAKVLVILGNHDTRIIKNKKKIESKNNVFIEKLRNIKNLHFLQNEGILIDNIYFYGYNPPFNYYNNEEKNIDILKNDFSKIKLDKNNLNILLVHSPINIPKLESILEYFKIIISGHTHDGMMPCLIKGNNGLIAPNKKLFPKNVRGKINLKNTSLIISGGITKLSYSAGFLRHFNFFYQSEVTIIDLK